MTTKSIDVVHAYSIFMIKKLLQNDFTNPADFFVTDNKETFIF